MTIIGAFFVPHGSIILNPSKEGIPDSSRRLHLEMTKISNKIKELNPDLCFLITPHGFSLSKDYGFYLNQNAEGTAEWENDYHQFKAKIELNQEETKKVFDYLKKEDLPISTITSFTSNMSIPLRWGEVVPLWFLREMNLEYVIMSIPTRRYNQAIEMIPELLNLGYNLSEYFTDSPKKAIILVSGDLAHSHSADGPFPFSEKAEEFDSLIEQWVKTGDKSLILNKASNILDQALCCGFTGLIILQGILEKIKLKPEFFFRAHPTYYGMLIASFT